MNRTKFAITKEGQVYHRQGSIWIRLGHISSVLKEEAPLALDVCEWWHARLASDDPTVNLAVGDRDQAPVLPVSETCFAAGWQPRQERAEAALAAD